MSIHDLVKVLKPPMAPAWAFHGPWEPIEADLGVRLPADYKAFVSLYGAGCMFDLLRIDVPVGSGGRELLRQAQLVAQIYSGDLGELLPYPTWPAEGGLLTFGDTSNGDWLFWRTVGEPDRWPVIVFSHSDDIEVFDMTCTAFLAGAISGAVTCKTLGPDLADCGDPFLPALSYARRWR